MNICRPLDTIDKVEQFFTTLRRDAASRSERTDLTAKSFMDNMLKIDDIKPTEQAALIRWFGSRMRG